MAKRKKPVMCEICGKDVGANRHKYCAECAADPKVRGSNNARLAFRREYQYLMESADIIDMHGFIRLLALAEMFGRDLEEWVNSMPRLARLQARLMEDRQQFDEGEKRRGKTDVQIDEALQTPTDVQIDEVLQAPAMKEYCGCAGCEAGRKRMEQLSEKEKGR